VRAGEDTAAHEDAPDEDLEALLGAAQMRALG
jgi:hypothetical protein